jgi:pyruvate dehydrogenase complex dehydrogenase (E1) component
LYANRPLTPRQDRIEATIEQVLRARGTRSELRDAVYQFADHARAQSVPPERMIIRLKAVAMRTISTADPQPAAVGDSLDERIAMIVRWCTARYYRVD